MSDKRHHTVKICTTLDNKFISHSITDGHQMKDHNDKQNLMGGYRKIDDFEIFDKFVDNVDFDYSEESKVISAYKQLVNGINYIFVIEL